MFACTHHLIYVWDIHKGRKTDVPLRDDVRNIDARVAAFSPDGLRVASGTDDCAVWIWNIPAMSVSSEDDASVEYKALYPARWNAYCARMDVADGWVKDEEKLLLWIPHRYR
jgi:WD40 repeat protein